MLNFLLLCVSKPFKDDYVLLLQQYFEISANEHLVCISMHFRSFWATFYLLQLASNFEHRCKSDNLPSHCEREYGLVWNFGLWGFRVVFAVVFELSKLSSKGVC